MKITPRNLILHELIGLKCKIVRSRDPTLIGIEGIVIDETLNTLLIKCNDGRIRRVVKRISTFHFTLPSGEVVEVEGQVICKRPEERTKEIPEKRW